MILSIAIGSNGKGDKRYGVFIPFELQAGYTFKLDSNKSNIQIFGQSLTLEQMHHRYAIHGGEFFQEQEAKDFFVNLSLSLLWYSLKQNFGLRYPQQISSVQLFDEEIPISTKNTMHKIFVEEKWSVTHGSYDADKAYIIPQHLCLSRFERGRGSVRLGLSTDNFQNTLKEAFELPNLSKLKNHPKLKLGIEMYSSSSFEISTEAKFLALIASLEATLESSKVSGESMNAIQNAKMAIKAQIDQVADSEKESLNHLLQRVSGLTEKSIGEKFRNQIAKRGEGLVDAQDLSKLLSAAYKIRSRLIHDGIVDQDELKSNVEFIQQFVPAYFEREFRRVTNAL